MQRTFRSPIAVPKEDLAAWHARRGAFERLCPPWERVEVLRPLEALAAGQQMTATVSLGPFRRQWVAEIVSADAGGFVDCQRSGPFASWTHRHGFFAGDHGCWLEDDIEAVLPFGPLGRLAEAAVSRRLHAAFGWRHRLTRWDLERSAELAPAGPMHLLITGGTGLIGTALQHLATTQGHRVTVLTRRPSAPHHHPWNPRQGALDLTPLGNIDAVVHLAGCGVGDRRWTPSYQRLIRTSRVQSTDCLVSALCRMPQPLRPAALVCASGISGVPADGKPHDETEPLDTSTFLGQVVAAWEHAAAPAERAGIRTVLVRTGVVLDPRGGMLRKVLPVFRAGLGGPLGRPSSHQSWIALEDVIEILLRAAQDGRYQGPIHAVAPQVVTQRQWARSLSAALRRPAVLGAPAPALRALMGRQMAEETALADLHAVPARLHSLDYPWRFPELGTALRQLLP